MKTHPKMKGFLPRLLSANWAASSALLLVALGSFALADGRIIRVARVSLIEGEVSYQRANDSRKDWFDATLNLPLDESDQIYSGPGGRAEIQLTGRNIVRIDRNTNLRFTQFNTGTVQLALPVGTAYFRIDSLDKRQFNVVDANDPGMNDPVYFEVDTPAVAITFVKEGNYRVNVRDDGTTEVIVRRGQAEVYNQEIGTIVVKKGRRLVIEGRDNFYQIARLEDKDNWDRWNDRRDDDLFARADSYRSTRYVPVGIPGVYDLDYHGDWINTPDYGWVWSPRSVASGWAPYRDGYWRWYPRYGWTWVSYEPWGWVPYHYGRWTYYRSRWCWTPYVNVSFGFDWGWRPHLVTFFGWGGRYSRGYRDGYYDGYWDGFRDGRYGWLGWCPLSPRDRYGSTTIVNNATIINAPGRTVDTLANYNAPGGVSGMDARRFTEGRVLVTQDVLNAPAPPRGTAAARARGANVDAAPPALVRTEDLKPLQTVTPTRNAVAARDDVSRRIEAPVVMRRAPVDTASPVRSLDGNSITGSRPSREAQTSPSGAERNAPARSGDSISGEAPTRINNGVIVRPERPARAEEYKPVERSSPPVWRSGDDNRGGTERGGEPGRPSREVNDSPREYPAPSRNADRPSRSESPSRSEAPSRGEKSNESSPTRRYDPPPRPQVERRETPRNEPRESAPPRENRRPDLPPARESAPQRSPEQRSPERPPSPPPARESAPQRTERPSPPARESAPSRPERPPDRSMPSRPTDPQ
jgi:hypothetical protein